MLELHGLSPKCSVCGSEYLHHSSVEVFERAEDAETGQHTFVDKDATIVDKIISRNPSPRRNGISIKLWCEDCATEYSLSIYQHKGGTYFEVEKEFPEK